MEMITVKTFDNYIAAHLLKGHLEDAGIPCFLKDEHTVTTYAVLTNAIGGIKLQVPVTKLQEAKVIVEALDIEYRNNAVCPHCGHKGLQYLPDTSPKGFLANIAAFFAFKNPAAASNTYQCVHCQWSSPQLPAASPEAEAELERAALSAPPEE